MDRDAGPDSDSDGDSVVARDPVCGMKVERALAAGIQELDGRTYFFCSASCKQTFRANPSHYAKNSKNSKNSTKASVENRAGGSVTAPASGDKRRR
jgi:YHS domain-containing protein